MRIYNISKIETNLMSFVPEMEEIHIPIEIKLKNDKKEANFEDKILSASLRYNPDTKKFRAAHATHYLDQNPILTDLEYSPQFEEERKTISAFIEMWSIEKPMPELTVVGCETEDVTNTVQVYFEGEGLRSNGTFSPSMKFYNTPDGKTYDWYNMNSLYLGFSNKVAGIIQERSKLYLLLAQGE